MATSAAPTPTAATVVPLGAPVATGTPAGPPALLLARSSAAAPIEFSVTAQPGRCPGERRVVARGRLDRRTAGLRAPSFLIGRRVDVKVEAVLVAP